ncbi:MAG: TonB-dependent receptor [Colwellia sp.]
MYNKRKVTKAIRLAMVVGTSAAATLSVSAFSAEEASVKEESIDRLVITGSRLLRPALTSPLPLATVTAAEIEASGFSSITDIFADMPSFNGDQFSIDENQPNNIGRQNVQIRGLGYSRTLHLIDGVRMAGGDTAGVADVSMIPTGMIEKVEIAKGASSAVYGSDAIAGVINYKLLKQYDGIKVKATTGISEEGDAPRNKVSIVAGKSFANGGFTVGLEIEKVESYMRGDRDFYNPDHSDQLVDGLFYATNWSSDVTPEGTYSYYINSKDENNNSVSTYHYFNRNQGSDGSTLDNYSEIIGDTLYWRDARDDASEKYKAVHGYDFFADELDGSDRTEYNVVLNGYYNITEDIEATLQVMASSRENYTQQAPAWVDRMRVEADAPGNPFNRWVYMRRRLSERNTTTDTTPLHVRLGFNGDFTNTESWSWTVDAVHSEIKAEHNYASQINLDTLAIAVNPTECAQTEGCVPLNVFVDTEDMLLEPHMVHGLQDVSEGETNILMLNAMGELWELPAGTMQLAVGAEYRTEEVSRVFDDIRAEYNLSGFSKRENVVPPKRTVTELYAEMSIPLLTDAPLAKHLSVELAARYSNYDDVGDKVVPSVNVFYKPIDDLLLRVNYAQGFRAPTLWDLHRGTIYTDNPTADFELDPCAGASWEEYALCQGFGAQVDQAASEEYSWQSGANPDLEPETSESINFGLVWTPSFIEGFSMTFDYWDVEIEDSPSRTTSVMFLENAKSNGTQFADNITRNAETNVVEWYNSIPLNIGNSEYSGYDVELDYHFPSTAIGNFRIKYTLAHMIEGRSKYGSTSDWTPEKGRWSWIPNKQSVKLFWDKNAWNASYSIFHGDETYSGYDEITSYEDFDLEDPEQFEDARYIALNWVPSYIKHYMTVGYKTQDFGRFTLNIQNPWGDDPEFYDRSEGYLRGPSPRGRYYTLSWSNNF